MASIRRLRISEAAEQYRQHGTAKGLAPGTILAQQSALTVLRETLGDLLLDSITGQHIDRLFNSHSWMPTTRNTKIGQYRAFFSWARSNRFMNPMSDPMAGWRQAAPPNVKRLRIPATDWPRLFAHCYHPQERMLLATGLYLFLRTSEIQGIKIGDVDLQGCLIDIYRQKTKQADTLPMSSELVAETRNWLQWLAETHQLEPDHYFLPARIKTFKREANRFVSEYGLMNLYAPIQQPHRIVQRVLARAGYTVERNQGVHILRRSGARAYFDALVDLGFDGALRRVQSMLGHRHAQMTELYLGIDVDRAQRNAALAGQPMFPHLQQVSFMPIREVL